MTAQVPHRDASTICARRILAAKHKGKRGTSTQETPHVFVENKINYGTHVTVLPTRTSLLFG